MNRLSADLFEQIIASLRSDNSRSNEKREKPRVGLRCSLDLFRVINGGMDTKSIAVWVRDVSAQGLGLVSSKALAKDMQFVAEFSRVGSQRLQIQYRVAYCKPLSNSLFSIGAKLVRVLPAQLESNNQKRSA